MSGQGYVYVLRYQYTPRIVWFKIGETLRDPSRRCNEINARHHIDAELIKAFTVPRRYEAEQQLCMLFDRWRCWRPAVKKSQPMWFSIANNTEWFMLPDAVADWLVSLTHLPDNLAIPSDLLDAAHPTFRTFVREPFDLALGQPHQMLISSASVAIVATEAAALIPLPFNVLLAVGAEWAYLRGLISGAGVTTPWAARLNWSAVLLVVLYGSLASLRGFGQIPGHPDLWLASLLTIIHIGSISAVTLCSAMLHRAGAEARAAEQKAAAAREEERAQRLQNERDAIDIEMERKRQELALWQQAEETKARLKMQAADARTKMRRDARPERTNAAPQTCPNCGVHIDDRATWLAGRPAVEALRGV